MDEIVKLVAGKVGISEDQARSAVETVVGYLKGKLPGPLSGQLDSLLSGGGGGLADMAGSLLGGLGKK